MAAAVNALTRHKQMRTAQVLACGVLYQPHVCRTGVIDLLTALLTKKHG